MNSKYSILVNSTDSFSDCWDAFFTLFVKYWPDCDQPIYLNTETKSYSHPGLSIISSQVQKRDDGNDILTWSECLYRCLELIKTDYVLYLQEDYFLDDEVKVNTLNELINLMTTRNLDVIRIMECGGAGPWHETDNPMIWEVDQKSEYRVSLQAGLWKTAYLKNLIRRHESPWHLEVYGSGRERKRNNKVFSVNRDLYINNKSQQIFPYEPTGIVKGKWNGEVVPDLFKKNGITVDFSGRGFYDMKAIQNVKRQPLAVRILNRLKSL